MATPKPLTDEGILRLIDTLGSDLAKVEASAASDAQKEDVRLRTGELQSLLRAARLDSPANWVLWVKDMGPKFALLSALLNETLGLPSGSCTYDGGCIITTQPECDGLHGIWVEGGSC
jgi:hypothetical protein